MINLSSLLRKGFCAFAFSLVSVFFTLQVNANPDRPTLKDYAAQPTLQSVSVSPSGEMLAFVHVVEKRKVIKLFDLKKRATVAAFDAGDILPRAVYFIDNDRVVIRVEDEKRRLMGYRGIHDISNAFIYSIKEKDMRQLLLPGDVIYSGQTQLGDIVAISANGKFAYMPAWAPKRKGSQAIRFSLMKVSLGQKRKSPKVFETGHSDARDYFMDDEDNLLAMEKYKEEDTEYSIQVPDGKKWRTIYQTNDALRPFSAHGVTPDKKHLVVLAYGGSKGRLNCYTLSLETGELSGKLFASDTKDIERVIIDKNRTVYGVQYSGFSPTYAFFDQAITKKVADIQNMFKGESVTIADYSPDWKHIVVHVAGSVYSGDYFLMSDGQSPLFIGAEYSKFKDEFLHPIFQTAFKASDERLIPVLVTVPHSKKANLNNLPAVLLPHGGPESHDKLGFDWIAQAIANEGYVVIQPQFRGSDGFGVEHILAGRGEWGKKMQTDIIEAVDTLVKEKVVDKDRVCIAGWSYGGYAALAGGAFHSDRFKCIVAVNGVTDLNRMLKKEKRDDVWNYDGFEYWKDTIAKGDIDADALDAISPAKNAENFSAPVLLIYSTRDEIVLPEQSKRMAKALKKVGKPYEIIKIKDEEHGFEDIENRQKTITAIVKFINAHLAE